MSFAAHVQEIVRIPSVIGTAPSIRVDVATALRRARWANTTFFLLLGVVFGSWVVRIPAVQNRLGLSDGQLGIALLSITCGAMLAMPVTGWLGLCQSRSPLV